MIALVVLAVGAAGIMLGTYSLADNPPIRGLEAAATVPVDAPRPDEWWLELQNQLVQKAAEVHTTVCIPCAYCRLAML